jgi:exosortase H (IPTLxxWG-CTERM-specific)
MAKQKPKRRSYKRQATADKKPQDKITLSALARSKRLRFVVFFTLSCIGLYACIYALPPSFTRPLNEHTAMTMGLVLNAIGMPVATVNDIVSGGGFAFRIIPECTVLFMAGLFLCFVVFYPATFYQKAAGLAMGIPGLYLGNLLRLTATFMVGRYYRQLFEVVHVYLGQVFTIFLIMMACFLWLKWLNKAESKWIKTVGFLIRFALISGLLFLVWMKIHYWYIWFLDRFMIFGFSLFNYHIAIARDTVVYYETFSIATLISLAFADLSASWRTKIKGLCAGLALLFSIHLFHRIDNALIDAFHFTAVADVDSTLVLIGQYLVPVLFLLGYCNKKKESGVAVKE